jgi:hypothetical protein
MRRRRPRSHNWHRRERHSWPKTAISRQADANDLTTRLGRLAERRAIISRTDSRTQRRSGAVGSVLPIAIVMDNRVVGRWGSVSAAHGGQRPMGLGGHRLPKSSFGFEAECG